MVASQGPRNDQRNGRHATLGLGALTSTQPALAVGLAVAITVLLVSRESLHRFVRETVTDQERIDALKFFVAAFVVLPVLPTGSSVRTACGFPSESGCSWSHHRHRLGRVRRDACTGRPAGADDTGLAGGFVSATATTGVMAAKCGVARLRCGERSRGLSWPAWPRWSSSGW